MIENNNKSIFLVLLISCLGVILLAPNIKVDFNSNVENFLMPPDQISGFTLGYNENITDALWIRVIQDFDHCEKGKYIEGALPDWREIVVGTAKKSQSTCSKSWVFHMLNAISEITPKFRPAYAQGATTLSVLVDDREGATVLFDKGVKVFPEDGEIAYRAAYHYLFMEQLPERAAELLIRSGNHGAPRWVFLLASRLFEKKGRAIFARSILEDALKADPNSKFADQLKKRLEEVNSILSQDTRPQEKNE